MNPLIPFLCIPHSAYRWNSACGMVPLLFHLLSLLLPMYYSLYLLSFPSDALIMSDSFLSWHSFRWRDSVLWSFHGVWRIFDIWISSLLHFSGIFFLCGLNKSFFFCVTTNCYLAGPWVFSLPPIISLPHEVFFNLSLFFSFSLW